MSKNDSKAPKKSKQKTIFKKTRGGVVLTREEVLEIKAGRKELRRDMRKNGIKSKRDFELTASSLGLYFDKNKRGALFILFLKMRGGWLILGLAIALIATLFAFSAISELQGHFTMNLHNSLLKEGFTLSETLEFENPTSRLFATSLMAVPEASILDIPINVDEDSVTNPQRYFSYTFYIRNEGESIVNYEWKLSIKAESHNVSSSTWFMVFEDGKAGFYAKAREDGTPEEIPDPEHAYAYSHLIEHAKYPDANYKVITRVGNIDYWRIVSTPFVSDYVVATGRQTDVEPGDVHKYTIVMWLEGDDPQCTHELIGGHLGLDMEMTMFE